MLRLESKVLHIVLTSIWEKQLNELCLSYGGIVIDLQNHSQELRNDIIETENAFQKLDFDLKKSFLEQAGVM